MSESKQRQFHTPELKAKVGLEAIGGIKTLNEIALEIGVHPVQVGQWKKDIQDHERGENYLDARRMAVDMDPMRRA